MKFKRKGTKIVIIITIIFATIFTSFASFIIFQESIIQTAIRNNKEEYEKAQEEHELKTRPIYDLQYKEEMPTVQQMSGPMGYDEASIIRALNQILGAYTPERLFEYLGLKDLFRADTIISLLPGCISGEIKHNVKATYSLAQAIKEFGWDRSKRGGKPPNHWDANNAFGIKVGGGKPNEYWGGSGETWNTHENVGGGRKPQKDGFRVYDTLWHSCMDHARLLSEEKLYVKANLPSKTNAHDWGYALGVAGYYTTNNPGEIEDYASDLQGVYDFNHFDKLEILVQQVKEVLARSGGGYVTPGGVAIPGGEWTPQNSLGGIQIANTNRIQHNYRKGNNRKIEYIVIHDTQNHGADAAAHFGYFNKPSSKASAHYGVDDKSIYQYVDDKDISFHCGDPKSGGYDRTIHRSNNNSIGIEMCVNDGSSFKTTVQKTLYLTKQLMTKYNIPLNRVIRHYDVSGKICPRQFSPNNWKLWYQFKKDLQYLIQGSNASNMGGPIYNGGSTGVTGGGGTALQGGQLRGTIVTAKYSAYYPSNDPLQGGLYAAYNSEKLNPDTNTCAAPPSVKFNTPIQPLGTGTRIDGQIYRVNDRGSAIQIQSGNVYRFDILMHNRKERYDFGRRTGKAIIGNGTGTSTSLSTNNSFSTGNTSPKPVQNSGQSVPSTLTQVIVTGNGRSAATSAGVNYDALPAARKAILDVAAKQLGKPYLWGATGPNKFDCSGLTQFVYNNALGIKIPRTSAMQANWKGFRKVSEDEAAPGDLVYHPGHIMIFLRKSDKPGKPIVLHAPHSGDVVKIGYASGKNNTFRKLL